MTAKINQLSQTYVCLSKAQAAVEWVQKTASNGHHGYNYVPVDMMVRACKKALLDNDLVLIPVGWTIQDNLAHGSWVLHHLNGGEAINLNYTMPVLESKGRAGDKAYLAAQSSCYKYMLRDLLMVPMLEEEVCGRKDEEVQPLRKLPASNENKQRLQQMVRDNKETLYGQYGGTNVLECCLAILAANGLPTDGTADDEQVGKVCDSLLD
jgi:hypothetical protein|tara:strand:+ start:1664 stop:2290 length:627 start_codon:yes stop_codon:yes gene_type:complete